MKRILLSSLMLLFVTGVFSQDIIGKWKGLLAVQGMELRVHFNITKTDNGFEGTLDSPDQNAYGLPLTSVEFKDKTLSISKEDIDMKYTGTLAGKDEIEGTFTQMGQSFEMKLIREKEE